MRLETLLTMLLHDFYHHLQPEWHMHVKMLFVKSSEMRQNTPSNALNTSNIQPTYAMRGSFSKRMSDLACSYRSKSAILVPNLAVIVWLDSLTQNSVVGQV